MYNKVFCQNYTVTDAINAVNAALLQLISHNFNPKPWIPEPSTVNNKLKCREGSGSTRRFFD
jgi:hypothetical protein